MGETLVIRLMRSSRIWTKGLENLTGEVRRNDSKQEEMNKKIEQRLNRLEIDARLAKYARMKGNSDKLDGRQTNSFLMDGRRDSVKDDNRKKSNETPVHPEGKGGGDQPRSRFMLNNHPHKDGARDSEEPPMGPGGQPGVGPPQLLGGGGG